MPAALKGRAWASDGPTGIASALRAGREVDVRVPGSLIQKVLEDRWPSRVDETQINGRANGETTMIDTGFSLSEGVEAATSNIAEVDHMSKPNSERRA